MLVDWFCIKFKSIVAWASLARFLFQLSKFGCHISGWQLLCESQLWRIAVFGIGTRQGCELFKVVPPHLILAAWICVCIKIGSLDRVIDAMRQVDWFHIKFKSIVGRLSLAKISLPVIRIWSSHFCLAIIVWESTVANSCIRHWHETGLQTF